MIPHGLTPYLQGTSWTLLRFREEKQKVSGGEGIKRSALDTSLTRKASRQRSSRHAYKEQLNEAQVDTTHSTGHCDGGCENDPFHGSVHAPGGNEHDKDGSEDS